MVNRGLLAVTLLLSCAVGCKGESQSKHFAGGAPEEPTKVTTEAPPPRGLAHGRHAKGLADPTNDKALVKAAEEWIACKRASKSSLPTCLARDVWNLAVSVKSAAPTLVNFLADDDKLLRFEAAKALGRLTGIRDNARLSRRILRAARDETDTKVAEVLGTLVGAIDAVRSGLGSQQQRLYETHKSLALRKKLLHSMQFNNREFHYEFTANVARTEPSDELREVAVSVFWLATPSAKNAEVCTLWSQALVKDIPEIQREALLLLASRDTCSRYFDQVLDFQAKDDNLDSIALARLYTHRSTSQAQKKRAAAIALKVLENAKASASIRNDALLFLVRTANKGRALARKYVNDRDAVVAKEAKQLLKGAERPGPFD